MSDLTGSRAPYDGVAPEVIDLFEQVLVRLAAMERRLDRLEQRVTDVVRGSGALIGGGGE